MNTKISSFNGKNNFLPSYFSDCIYTKYNGEQMIDKKDERPACFGILDNVFPKGENGMRVTPESCFPCYFKTECLKKAAGGIDGLKIQEEKIDRAYESGIINFFERWSRKKFIQQKMKDGTD